MFRTVKSVYLTAKAVYGNDVELTAGMDSLDRPVLDISSAGDRQSSQSVSKYDVVFYHPYLSVRCHVLDAAEIIIANGASMLVVCRTDYLAYDIRQLRLLCGERSFPLMEVSSADLLPRVMHCFYSDFYRMEGIVCNADFLLRNVLHLPWLTSRYSDSLRMVGHSEKTGYCVAVVWAVSADSEELQADELLMIKNTMEIGIASVAPETVVVFMGNQTALIFMNRQENEVNAALQSGLRSVSVEPEKKVRFFVGISERGVGLSELPALYDCAVKLAALHMRFGNDSIVVRPPERLLCGFLGGLKDRAACEGFVKAVLGPIVEHDRRFSSSYMQYLWVFYGNNCYQKKTAKDLYIHKNSAGYTMRKIEGIVGGKFSDADTTALILMALMLSATMNIDVEQIVLGGKNENNSTGYGHGGH